MATRDRNAAIPLPNADYSALGSLKALGRDLWSIRIAAIPLVALILAELIRIIFYQLGLGCRLVADRLPGICQEIRLPASPAGFNAALSLEGLPARIAWYGTSVVAALAALGALALSLWILVACVKDCGSVRRACLLVLVVGVGCFICANSYADARTFVLIEHLLDPSTHLFTPSVANFLLSTAGTTRVITFLPLAPVVAALGGLMVGATRTADPATLARHSRNVRLLLYASALVLVLCVVELHTFLRWLATGLQEPLASAMKPSIAAAVGASGMIYACYLALMFVPAVFILGDQTNRVADNADPAATPEARQKWLVEHNLATPWHRVASSLLAILSPFLVGSPLTQVVDLLKGQ